MTSRSLTEDHKSFFQQINPKDRSAYRKKMLETPQLKGQQPIFYHKQFPQEGKFTYKDFILHYRSIEQSINPKGLVFFFHGMYTQGGRCGYLANIIAQKVKNVNVYALDFKNAGLSEGQCPGNYTIEEIQEQSTLFIQHIQEKFKTTRQKPRIFIMGESMGGLLTFKLCLKNPEKFTGAVMLAPALKDCSQNIPFLKKLGRIMGSLCPAFKIVPQEVVGFNRYENTQSITNEKGRYLGPHPPGTAYSILKHMDTCQNDFSKMRTPYLCIQGGVDKSVDLFAPLDLQKQAATRDKTTLYWKDMWHDVMVDQEIKEIAPIVADWIKKRI